MVIAQPILSDREGLRTPLPFKYHGSFIGSSDGEKSKIVLVSSYTINRMPTKAVMKPDRPSQITSPSLRGIRGLLGPLSNTYHNQLSFRRITSSLP